MKLDFHENKLDYHNIPIIMEFHLEIIHFGPP